MLIQAKIEGILRKALDKVAPGYKVDIELTRPAKREYGDFSTNLLFKLSKELDDDLVALGKNFLAALELELKSENVIDKVELRNAGFVNFYIKDDYFIKNLIDGLYVKQPSYKNELVGKTVVVEYTDPNPFKVFHIGHLMTNTIGESIARICKEVGADVKKLNYQGDVGMHVAKSVWGIHELLALENMALEDVEKLSLSERVEFMGRGYAFGSNAYKDSESKRAEIERINTLCYIVAQERLIEEEGWSPEINYSEIFSDANNDNQLEWVRPIYKKGRKWSLEYFETVYALLGTKFDRYYFESKVGEYGLALVRKHIGKIFEYSQGAVIFKGERFGLHTRVFINQKGLPVYEAKDLALAFMKYEDFKYDLSIVVTANEINEYFDVVLKALEQIDESLARKTIHIGHGMLVFATGKMSSRRGNVVAAMDLIEQIKEKVRDFVKEEDLSDDEKGKIVNSVSIGAWKYSVLRQQIGRDIVFDFDKSISLEGNSGPYLQYTYARARSVLRKVGNSELKAKFDTSLTILPKERELLERLDSFSDIVQAAARSYAPHVVAMYLYDLAQEFNSYYSETRIMVSEEDVASFRLMLTATVAQVLKKGLYLLGITTVERM